MFIQAECRLLMVIGRRGKATGNAVAVEWGKLHSGNPKYCIFIQFIAREQQSARAMDDYEAGTTLSSGPNIRLGRLLCR
ncbi:hypothetical protein GCM10027180_35610 [Microbulbifer echini]